MREKPSNAVRPPSIARRGMPQRQHAVERETIDRLRHAALLDLTRDAAQAERVERDGGRRAQEGEIAKARHELVIAHRQVLLDALLRLKPCDRGLLVADLVDQLELDRLTAG